MLHIITINTYIYIYIYTQAPPPGDALCDLGTRAPDAAGSAGEAGAAGCCSADHGGAAAAGAPIYEDIAFVG